MLETLLIIILIAGAGIYLVWNFIHGKPPCHSGCSKCPGCPLQKKSTPHEPFQKQPGSVVCTLADLQTNAHKEMLSNHSGKEDTSAQPIPGADRQGTHLHANPKQGQKS